MVLRWSIKACVNRALKSSIKYPTPMGVKNDRESPVRQLLFRTIAVERE